MSLCIYGYDVGGTFVFAVRVGTKVAASMGVRVALGLAVGIVAVTVGRSVGVWVEAVEVGKGPKSA